MSPDIRARFLPKFAKAGAERISRCFELASRGESAGLAAQMHALAGEAAILELRVIADLAREAESLARNSGSSAECERALRVLAEHVAALHVDA